MRICGNCGRSLERAKEIGTSSLYFPNGFDIELCIDCYWEEEELQEVEGTNDHPRRLAHYLRTLGQKRAADRVIADAEKDGRLNATQTSGKPSCDPGATP